MNFARRALPKSDLYFRTLVIIVATVEFSQKVVLKNYMIRELSVTVKFSYVTRVSRLIVSKIRIYMIA